MKINSRDQFQNTRKSTWRKFQGSDFKTNTSTWRIPETSFKTYTTSTKVVLKNNCVCTGTCGGSEMSLNTVLHENVKVYTNQYVNFIKNFLKFFQKLPSAYIFINCINWLKLVKFVKIIFHAYLNFIKLSNSLKIFWKASSLQKF